MELHRTSGRRGLGLALAALTMLMWGALPIALKGVLGQLDPATITWYRFAVSSVLVGSLMAARRHPPRLSQFRRPQWVLLAAATVFLAINYLAYLVALDYTTPADAQVMIQLAPLLLALGGLWVFRERFGRVQWIGFAVLISGLALFFASQLRSMVADIHPYLLGNGIMVIAAVTWAIYGLAQKQLLHTLSSQAIMVCVYVGCTLLFLPLAEPATLSRLDATGWWLLAFCALNTAVAYGAFSESLQHWEASRVSAVLALTPIATLAFAELARWLSPELGVSGALPVTSIVGALVVVAGSLATALGGADPPVSEKP